MKKQEQIWNRLSKHLNEDKKQFVLDLFSECFDYSPFIPWDKIVAELVSIMHWRQQHFHKKNKVVQVKSKFGQLRFYIEGDGDDYLRGAIKMAEVQCSKICPFCGSYDLERTPSGRFVKRCVQCDEGSFEMT